MGMCANLHQFEVNSRPSLSRDIISAGEAGATLQPVLMGESRYEQLAEYERQI